MNWPERNWITVNGKLMAMGGFGFRFRVIDGRLVLAFVVPGKPDLIMPDLNIDEPDQWWR